MNGSNPPKTGQAAEAFRPVRASVGMLAFGELNDTFQQSAYINDSDIPVNFLNREIHLVQLNSAKEDYWH